MHIFYEPEITGNSFELNESESIHCARVLRLKSGDNVQVIDGKGNLFFCTITEVKQKKCLLNITHKESSDKKRPYKCHIAIAPTKSNDRFEWFLEKSAEIGIDEVTPLLCMRSERKHIKPDRFEKIIIAALKQSKNLFKPILNPMTSFSDFIRIKPDNMKLFIAHCIDNQAPLLKDIISKKDNCLILIGPEGDFTPEEVENARKHGFTEISLGENRYRTETAGIISCHTIHLINQ